MTRLIALILSLVVVIPILLFCGPICWGFFNLLVWTPFQMDQAIRPYDGSTLVQHVSEGILTNTLQDTLYYGTADPLEKVKASYEQDGLKFVAGTSQDDWWITVYNKNRITERLSEKAQGLARRRNMSRTIAA